MIILRPSQVSICGTIWRRLWKKMMMMMARRRRLFLLAARLSQTHPPPPPPYAAIPAAALPPIPSMSALRRSRPRFLLPQKKNLARSVNGPLLKHLLARPRPSAAIASDSFAQNPKPRSEAAPPDDADAELKIVGNSLTAAAALQQHQQRGKFFAHVR